MKLWADDGVTLVELLRFTSHGDGSAATRPIYQIGPSHVAFTVDDLDAAYLTLVRAGIVFTASPQLSPDGYAKLAYCYDPDRTPVEPVQVLR